MAAGFAYLSTPSVVAGVGGRQGRVAGMPVRCNADPRRPRPPFPPCPKPSDLTCRTLARPVGLDDGLHRRLHDLVRRVGERHAPVAAGDRRGLIASAAAGGVGRRDAGAPTAAHAAGGARHAAAEERDSLCVCSARDGDQSGRWGEAFQHPKRTSIMLAMCAIRERDWTTMRTAAAREIAVCAW